MARKWRTRMLKFDRTAPVIGTARSARSFTAVVLWKFLAFAPSLNPWLDAFL